MRDIYFGLGSNLGNRIENLRNAVERLREIGEILSASKVYETPAWGGIEQPDYMNACVKVRMNDENANMTPREILSRIKDYEKELGRVENIRWGARKIDIDILLIDDEIYHDDSLDVPHIRIPERLFVLIPLRDIMNENWRHPVNHKSINEMIENLGDTSAIKEQKIFLV